MNYAIEAVQRRMDRARAEARMELRRGLGSLACVAVTAPLLGFLGGCEKLVVGACSGDPWSCTLMTVTKMVGSLTPIAWALAVGVAAGLALRYFSRRVDDFEIEMKDAALVVLGWVRVGR